MQCLLDRIHRKYLCIKTIETEQSPCSDWDLSPATILLGIFPGTTVFNKKLPNLSNFLTT